MRIVISLCLVLLLSVFWNAELKAQRGGGGRGQSFQKNRGQQSNRPVQRQSGNAENSRNKGSMNGRGQAQQGRGQGQSQMGNRGQGGQGQGRQGNGHGGNGQQQSGSTLSDIERNGLTLMREEEKLARDVYVALNKKWGATIFANIARAESKHMSAVGGLLSRYQIPDPVVSNSPGSFTNPRFQLLYQSLVREGSGSEIDALKVGLKIEEMDIVDVRVAIQSTRNNDVVNVLQHLEQGSQNHLRAFAAQLKKSGGTYTSTQLSQNEFNDIANSKPSAANNRGARAKQGQGQGQGAGNGKRTGRASNGKGGSQRQSGKPGKGRGRK